MRICIITYSYPPYTIGGADIYAHQISEKLSKKGNEVIVITTKPYSGLSSIKPSIDNINGIKVYRFYPLNIFSWINIAKKSMFQKIVWHLLDLWNLHVFFVVRHILKNEKPDIVHVQTPLWVSLSVFNAVKSLKLPLIFTLHDFILLCRKGHLLNSNNQLCHNPKKICEFYQLFTKIIVDNAPDIVIAPSKLVLDIFKKKDYFKNSKYILLPHGIDISSKLTKKELNCINVLYVGSLVEHKGVHVLIKAFKKLNHDNIILNIIGKGENEKKLKILAKSDKRIIFNGYKSRNEVNDFYKKANICVFPSLSYETFGLVVLESFKYGTPVIGSNVSSYNDLIEEGFNGFLFEKGNINELVEILSKIMNDPSILIELGNNAFNYVKNHEMNKHVSDLENIYEQTI